MSMIYSIWMYRFKPGLTSSTLDKLRARGVEKLYPGAVAEGGTFLGRCWGHPKFTYGSVFRRDGVQGLRAEAADVENLLRNLRILGPSIAAFEVRNLIPRGNEELASLGDEEWNARVVAPWIEAYRANAEVAYHMNVIGMSCLKYDTVPPYMVQAAWRDKFGYPQVWLGGAAPSAQLRQGAMQGVAQ